MVRLRDYFETDGKTTVGVSYSWSPDDQYQMQRGPLPDQWLLVKGYGAPAKVEEFRIIDGAVCRGHDTSMQGDKWYQLCDLPLPVSKWLPDEMNEGDWFLREPTVIHYRRSDGKEVFRGPHRTWALLKKVHSEWTGLKGLKVRNVIEIHVFDGDAGKASGKPFEIYGYATGIGPVWWEGEVDGKWGVMKANAVFNGPILQPAPLPGGRQYQPMPATPVPPPVTSPAAWKWHRPVRAPFVITSSYGERVRPEDWNKPPAEQRKEVHPATDYTSADWTAYAAQDGKVVFAGWDTSGYGNLIKLDHGNGRTSLYAHLESFTVAVGDTVTAGQKIGVIGSTGRSTARHLHWEVRLNNVAYAPAPETVPHPLDTATPPPVTPPVTTPEPVTPPPFEIEFATPAGKNEACDMVIEIMQLIKAAPGRKVYMRVTAE